MIGKYPCQQLYGGHPDIVKLSVDINGMCRHPECKPKEMKCTKCNTEVKQVYNSKAAFYDNNYILSCDCFATSKYNDVKIDFWVE